MKKVRDVQDLAWGYGYKEGHESLREHLLQNPGADLRVLNLASLEPDLRAFCFAKTLGKDLVTGALPNPPPPLRGLL